jgi:hypothetical protein
MENGTMADASAEWLRLMIEECPFHVGQRVTVSPNCEYASDWPGQYVITGIRWKYQGEGRIDISIASDDEITKRHGDTDGFRPHDLLPARS